MGRDLDSFFKIYVKLKRIVIVLYSKENGERGICTDDTISTSDKNQLNLFVIYTAPWLLTPPSQIVNFHRQQLNCPSLFIFNMINDIMH